MTDALNLLRDHDVRFVQVVWCDNANVIRAKAPHVDVLEDTGGAVGISAAQQALPVTADAVVPGSGLGPVGEVMLVPDWSTLRPVPWLPGFARALGDMVRDDAPWEHCPRAFLRAQIERLAAQGLSAQAAFENEFFLLRRGEDGRLAPSDRSVFATAHAMNASGPVMLAIADALARQGIEVETYYPESGPGQHELSVRYRGALAAADAQIVYRETVRGVAAQHGLVASFLPKVVEDAAGSGCHVNLSLWRGEENVTGDASRPTRLGREAEAFMAGVLDHLPALAALTLPSHLSYRRIRPHFWAGAFAAWGYDNREAALRVFGAGATPKRFEVKAVDATANPYLALGAILAAGADGLERGLELPPETTVDPGRWSDVERAERGVAALPRDLDEAIAALACDEGLLAALGEARARTYLAVRRAELEALRELPFDDEVELLAERY